MLGCYVDDLFTLYSSDAPGSLYREFVDALESRWDVEDKGEVSDLLNVEIDRGPDGVLRRHTTYIHKLVDTFCPDGVPASFTADSTPAAPELPQLVLEALSQSAPPSPAAVQRYQSICGTLLYAATHTRPDIAYAVGVLCRAMTKPTPALYDACLRVIYYLHSHRLVGLVYYERS